MKVKLLKKLRKKSRENIFIEDRHNHIDRYVICQWDMLLYDECNDDAYYIIGRSNNIEDAIKKLYENRRIFILNKIKSMRINYRPKAEILDY